MLTIKIKDGLQITATEHAWETQEYEDFSTGTFKWRFVAHHTTIINALNNVRQRLIKHSKSEGLVKAQADADKLLTESLTSQDRYIKQLISLHGAEEIEQLNLRSKDERIEIEV